MGCKLACLGEEEPAVEYRLYIQLRSDLCKYDCQDYTLTFLSDYIVDSNDISSNPTV